MPIAVPLNTAEPRCEGWVVHEGQQQSCPIQQRHPPARQVVTIATVRVVSLKNSQLNDKLVFSALGYVLQHTR